MTFRTDLALERREALPGRLPGITSRELRMEKVKITHICVKDAQGEKALEKPMGNYVTVELPAFTDHLNEDAAEIKAIAEQLASLLPPEGLVLVAGLGNEEITPDALGPWAVQRVLVTRHLKGELARCAGLDSLRPVAAISAGVLGQTGIETRELFHSLVKELRPAAVIAIDALASRKLERLGCTIQMSDTGISPGAGVGNHRPELNEKTLGAPVISIGVPTVVDAATLAGDLVSPEDESDAAIIREMVAPRGERMMVTPREVDLLVRRAAATVSLAINSALQPSLQLEEIRQLVLG